MAYGEDGLPKKGTSNVMAVASADLDASILESRIATDKTQAIQAHHRVQQLIHDEACWVPGWTTSYWRFAQWRWVCWPNTSKCRFCPPRYYDPLDSHLYWIDEDERKRTLKAKSSGASYEEVEYLIPLPEADAPRKNKTARSGGVLRPSVKSAVSSPVPRSH